MIAVIVLFQASQSLFGCPSVVLAHPRNSFAKISEQLLLRDAADCCEVRVERDIPDVVQTAENVDLSELAHAREKHELQIIIVGLHHAVKIVEHTAVGRLQPVVAAYIGHRTIILIDENYHPLAGEAGDLPDYLVKAGIGRVCLQRQPVLLLTAVQSLTESACKIFPGSISTAGEVEVQHGICSPLARLESVNGQAAEEYAVATEILFHG